MAIGRTTTTVARRVIPGVTEKRTTEPAAYGPVQRTTVQPILGQPAATTSLTDVGKSIASAPGPSWNDQTKPGIGETGGTAAGDALMKPGPAESIFGVTYGKLNAPTAAESHWNEVRGKFNGGPMMTDNTQSAYDIYMKDRPSLNLDPNMGKFYDNAATKFNQDTNTQLGARGAFNSSAALDKIAQGNATLRGQQAKDEAQYGLDRADVINRQGQTSGLLANYADTQSGNRAKTSLDYLKEGGVEAKDASDAELSRITLQTAGATAAGREMVDRLEGAATAYLGAQGARDGRVQNAFADVFKFGQQASSTVSDWVSKMLAGDSALFDAVNSGEIAKAAEKLGLSTADANKLVSDLKALGELVTAGKGGGGSAPAADNTVPAGQGGR